ncbi:PREDICTED: uncharacterized protein LOC105954487 [Erythranthe guttata]|uniref:uncharacterized protein LOC105954487 n=1 Tax=Erythranthe guttata TaxID=4155 RepID=UPI00064DE667|nr:PREDICTED: uncharacterized protein LOC105954487 [Erythranthe guttata]|eukprot:XP_012833613.1 PREDICTED: uncharacterized protein LOC105954487 [Erythranthe guttata]
MRKRIGNGKTTAILGEPWLMEDGNLNVFTRRSMQSAFPNLVVDLINQDSNSWNVDLIDQYFWPVDQDRILHVPIGSGLIEDSWVWHYSANGNFTVRSCYLNALNRRLEPRASQRRAGGDGSGEVAEDWKMVWKLKLPPKIKNFVWRACAEITPTGAELFRRRITPTPEWARCGSRIETMVHTTYECSGMSRIWQPPHLISNLSLVWSPFGAGLNLFGGTWTTIYSIWRLLLHGRAGSYVTTICMGMTTSMLRSC